MCVCVFLKSKKEGVQVLMELHLPKTLCVCEHWITLRTVYRSVDSSARFYLVVFADSSSSHAQNLSQSSVNRGLVALLLVRPSFSARYPLNAELGRLDRESFNHASFICAVRVALSGW